MHCSLFTTLISARTRPSQIEISKALFFHRRCRAGNERVGCDKAVGRARQWRGLTGRPGICMTNFDGVVIGAGHNGLTTAAYLARAGMKVAVVERNARIGGGCSTDTDRLPGFRLNLHANFYMGMSPCSPIG